MVLGSDTFGNNGTNLPLPTVPGSYFTNSLQQQTFTTQSLRVQPGEVIAVIGPSGAGKSTLIRAMADVWPYGHGQVGLPQDAPVMFLPQRSYLPIGSLRAALSYPAAEGSFEDALITHYLALCRLSHLADRLDVAANWSQALSPGEQQRLAFVRVFLNRPRIVFLDEASSAMDGETEEALYAALPRELPRRRAGESGVFWRRPPSTYGMPSMATGGKSRGIAAEARACEGPRRVEIAETCGSRDQGRSRPSRVS
jgi:ABC-type transport system involved in cytochrome bd biosynthesis fused ATPase/permease subunit